MLDCGSWNENKLCSEFEKYIPLEEKLDKNIPFEKALSLEVELPVEKNGIFDVYIDDFIGVTVDINNNKSRLEKSPCIVIHVVPHNSENDTFVPRDLREIDKYKAKGVLSEKRTCLGWL